MCPCALRLMPNTYQNYFFLNMPNAYQIYGVKFTRIKGQAEANMHFIICTQTLKQRSRWTASDLVHGMWTFAHYSFVKFLSCLFALTFMLLKKWQRSKINYRADEAMCGEKTWHYVPDVLIYLSLNGLFYPPPHFFIH